MKLSAARKTVFAISKPRFHCIIQSTASTSLSITKPDPNALQIRKAGQLEEVPADVLAMSESHLSMCTLLLESHPEARYKEVRVYTRLSTDPAVAIGTSLELVKVASITPNYKSSSSSNSPVEAATLTAGPYSWTSMEGSGDSDAEDQAAASSSSLGRERPLGRKGAKKDVIMLSFDKSCSSILEEDLIVLPNTGSIVLPLVDSGLLLGLMVAEPSSSPSPSPSPSSSPPSSSVQTALKATAASLSKSLAVSLKLSIAQSRLSSQSRATLSLLDDARRGATAINTFGAMLLPRMNEPGPERDLTQGLVSQGKRLQGLIAQLEMAIQGTTLSSLPSSVGVNKALRPPPSPAPSQVPSARPSAERTLRQDNGSASPSLHPASLSDAPPFSSTSPSSPVQVEVEILPPTPSSSTSSLSDSSSKPKPLAPFSVTSPSKGQPNALMPPPKRRQLPPPKSSTYHAASNINQPSSSSSSTTSEPSCDALDVLSSIVDALRSISKLSGINVIFDPSSVHKQQPPLTAPCQPSELRQALSHILDLVLQSTCRNGIIHISLDVLPLNERPSHVHASSSTSISGRSHLQILVSHSLPSHESPIKVNGTSNAARRPGIADKDLAKAERLMVGIGGTFTSLNQQSSPCDASLVDGSVDRSAATRCHKVTLPIRQ